LVDEDEFDSRRAICVSDMKDLELQFLKLKEDLINEKQMLIDQKLKEIEEESAEEYTHPSHKLKQNMEIKIKLATLLKDYRLKNLDHIYQYELMSIKQSLENDKTMLFDKQVNKLENQIKQLEESKRQFMLEYSLFKLNQNGSMEDEDGQQNIDSINNNNENDESNNHDKSLEEDLNMSSNSKKKLNSSFNKKTSNKKSPNSKYSNISPVLMPGAPFIVYSLNDYDILEDWSIIKMHNNLKNGTSLL